MTKLNKVVTEATKRSDLDWWIERLEYFGLNYQVRASNQYSEKNIRIDNTWSRHPDKPRKFYLFTDSEGIGAIDDFRMHYDKNQKPGMKWDAWGDAAYHSMIGGGR